MSLRPKLSRLDVASGEAAVGLAVLVSLKVFKDLVTSLSPMPQSLDFARLPIADMYLNFVPSARVPSFHLSIPTGHGVYGCLLGANIVSNELRKVLSLSGSMVLLLVRWCAKAVAKMRADCNCSGSGSMKSPVAATRDDCCYVSILPSPIAIAV